MLLLFICMITLVCIFLLLKIIRNKKVSIKNNKFLIIFSSIVVLIIIVLGIIGFFQHLPHNMVSKEERNILENYILNNYGLQLKVIESEIVYRGDIGINPGSEYNFVLKNSMGFKYRININTFSCNVDLKTILSENPQLNFIQME